MGFGSEQRRSRPTRGDLGAARDQGRRRTTKEKKTTRGGRLLRRGPDRQKELELRSNVKIRLATTIHAATAPCEAARREGGKMAMECAEPRRQKITADASGGLTKREGLRDSSSCWPTADYR